VCGWVVSVCVWCVCVLCVCVCVCVRVCIPFRTIGRYLQNEAEY